MHKNRFFILLLISTGLIAQSYLWPTNASNMMTSSFCEYRPGHFHAGIDVKTWGKEGYPVYAIESGAIMRIRVSPYGYGRAVYLKLNNGITVIYGHLSKFPDRLQQRVRQFQNQNGRYQTDLWFKSGDLRVEKGEIIGFTGSTGIGAPHLHFEVRDSLNRPFNPLDLGYSIEDHRSPHITSLSVLPLSYGAFVEDDLLPLHYSATKISGDEFFIDSVIAVWGQIGLCINVYDQADGAGNKFAPKILRLAIDDSLVYQIEYQKFSYEETHLVDLDRNYRLRKWGWGNFQNLFFDPKNSIDFYTPRYPGAGVLLCGTLPSSEESAGVMLAPGMHSLNVEAEDYWGNQSRLNATLSVQPPHLTAQAQTLQPEGGLFQAWPKIDIETTWLDGYVRFQIHIDSTWAFKPRFLISMAESVRTVPVFHQHNNIWIGDLSLKNAASGDWYLQVFSPEFNVPIYEDTIHVFEIRPDENRLISSDDGYFWCRFRKGSLYRTYWGIIKKTVNTEAVSVLEYEYAFKPDDVPLRKSIDIMFHLPYRDSLLQGEAIFAAGTEYRFISNAFYRHERWAAGQTSDLGRYALLRDTVPPEILFVRPAPDAVVRQTLPKITVGFQDTLSGIYGEENYQIHLNGERLIVEYDPEEDIAFAQPEKSLQSSSAEVEIQIRDKAGNLTTKKWRFTKK